MKILNIVLIIVSILVLIGLFFTGGDKTDTEPIITGSSNTEIISLDLSVLIIQEDSINILEGTTQTDILTNISSNDGTPQTYKITTSEGSDKTLAEIYEDDRLYVTAENGVNEGYYIIKYTDSLN